MSQQTFTPANVSGLQGWFKGSSISGVDGDAISTWPDSSGNGRDATQATAGSKPTLKTGANGINAQPVARFDGGDKLASSLATSHFGGSGTILAAFAVVKPTDYTNYMTILGASASGGFHWRLNQTTGRANVDKSAESNVGTATAAGSAGAGQVHAFTDAGSAQAFYLNGAAAGTAATAATFQPATYIIGDVHYSLPFLGDIAEILVYSAVPSAGDRTAITAYLGAKYAISVV